MSCTEEKGKYHIELDATAFFPEGGGQPGDQGDFFPGLKEDGEPVKVLDTREKAGVIFHVTDKAILEGTEVLGRLNWDKRLRNIQNHSGEHILSGLIHAKYGYNVGFHMGSDAVTLGYVFFFFFVVYSLRIAKVPLLVQCQEISTSESSLPCLNTVKAGHRKNSFYIFLFRNVRVGRAISYAVMAVPPSGFISMPLPMSCITSLVCSKKLFSAKVDQAILV